MSYLKRLWGLIEKRSLLLAAVLPGLIFYLLLNIEDLISRGDSVWSFAIVLLLWQHWYLGHFLGLDETFFATTGGFFPLPISLPLLLLVAILNYVVLIIFYYAVIRIVVRVRRIST
jgi:hypothetical protein